jgi:hypothetical protein
MNGGANRYAVDMELILLTPYQQCISSVQDPISKRASSFLLVLHLANQEKPVQCKIPKYKYFPV